MNPVALAREYERAGAGAISVLTDRKFFKGREENLSAIRPNVTLPLLRKEFIIDPYQICEARALGADAVLLIAAILSRDQLNDLLQLTESLGMNALVEVHEVLEWEKVQGLPLTVLGINNRNLKTFKVSLRRTRDILERISGHQRKRMVVVSESGIKTRGDVRYLKDLGVDAILVGETLMRSPSPAAKIRELLVC